MWKSRSRTEKKLTSLTGRKEKVVGKAGKKLSMGQIKRNLRRFLFRGFRKNDAANQRIKNLLPWQSDVDINALSDAEIAIMEKADRALGVCQTRGVDHPILVRNGSGGTSVMGLFPCSRSNFCPHCANLAQAEHCNEALESFTRWTSWSENATILAATLTVPSVPNEERSEVFELLRATWREFTHSGRRLGSVIDAKGYIKAVEIMYSPGKCHPHLHVAFFVEGNGDEKPDHERELEMSRRIWAVWQESLVVAIKKMRAKRKRFASWIDITKKEIIKYPYIGTIEEVNAKGEVESFRDAVKGGVSVEMCRDKEKFARYMAKEMSLSSTKTGDGSVHWTALATIDGTWAGAAYIDHIIMTYRQRMWDYSKGFKKWLKENTNEPEKEEKPDPVIIAESNSGDLFNSRRDEEASEKLDEGLDEIARSPDKITEIGRLTAGVFRAVNTSEECQKILWERYKAELTYCAERLNRGRKAAQERKNEAKYRTSVSDCTLSKRLPVRTGKPSKSPPLGGTGSLANDKRHDAAIYGNSVGVYAGI